MRMLVNKSGCDVNYYNEVTRLYESASYKQLTPSDMSAGGVAEDIFPSDKIPDYSSRKAIEIDVMCPDGRGEMDVEEYRLVVKSGRLIVLPGWLKGNWNDHEPAAGSTIQTITPIGSVGSSQQIILAFDRYNGETRITALDYKTHDKIGFGIQAVGSAIMAVAPAIAEIFQGLY